MSYITQLRDANEENIYPVTLDDAVRDASGNTLSSRLENMDENMSSYNVSANNGDAPFTLETAIAAVPEKYHRGGLNLTFISSVSGQYEQYRLMNPNWSANVNNWQGVDENPVYKSKNLVNSGGVFNSFIGWSIDSGACNTLISEIYSPSLNLDEIEKISLILVHITSNRYYNSIYARKISGGSVVLYEKSFETEEEAIADLQDGQIKTDGNHNTLVLFSGKIYKSTTSSVETYKFVPINDLKYSPRIALHLKKNIPVEGSNDIFTSGGAFSLEENIKADFKSSAFAISDNIIVNSIIKYISLAGASSEKAGGNNTLKIAFQDDTDGKYYNSLKLEQRNGTYKTAFEESFDTIEECYNSLVTNPIKTDNTTYQVVLNPTNISLISGEFNFILKKPISNRAYIPYPCIYDDYFVHNGIFKNNCATNSIIKEVYTTINLELERVTCTLFKKNSNDKYAISIQSAYKRDSTYLYGNIVNNVAFDTLQDAVDYYNTNLSGQVVPMYDGRGYVYLNPLDNISDGVFVSDVAYLNIDTRKILYSPTINNYLNNSIRINDLFGKKVVWEGDSIAAGNAYGNQAWRIPIEEKYGMTGVSYAVGGSVVTSNIINSSTGTVVNSISNRIDEEVASNLDMQYFIFDGGTNDADRIGRIVRWQDGSDDKILERVQSMPSKFGTWNEKDFSGNYDKDTYCGAIEYIIWKVMTSCRGVKIGYIGAQKMGLTTLNNGLTFFNRREYMREAIKICKKWGVPVINLWDDSWMNSNMPNQYDQSLSGAEAHVANGDFYVDTQHPAPAGYDYLSNLIGNWMNAL